MNSKESELIKSIEHNDLETFKSLLKDPEICLFHTDDYAIRLAACKGHTTIVELLLKEKTVNPSANNNESLLLACKYGHIEVVKLLLNNKKVKSSDFKHTAILEALYNRKFEIIDLLWKDNNIKNYLKVHDKESYDYLVERSLENAIHNF